LLYSYCEKLIDGGVSDVAWKTLCNLKIKDERLLALRHDLFSICGGEERTMSKEPEKPRNEGIQAINNALHPSRSQQRNPIFSPSSTAPASSPSAYSYSSQNRQPFTATQHSGMPPRPPMYPSQPYSNYPTTQQPLPVPPPIPAYQQYSGAGYAPTPPPTIPGPPGPPPVPGFQSTSSGSMYGQPPMVPGFNPIQAPVPPPPVTPASFSNMPSNNYNYANNLPQGNYAPTPPIASTEYSSKSSTVSPVGGSGGDSKETSTHAWNDPPPLTTRRPTPPAAPVFEVNWKPLEQPTVTLPNGLPGVGSGAPVRPPSSASTHQHQEHREVPQVVLSPEDQAIMDRFHQLINSILSVNRTPLSFATRKLLWQCSEQSSHGDYRGAVATCGQMVRSGGDFVEVSAFLPALKSLFSLAQSTFAR
ncbi:hypothetical protein OSTOST_25859, partial [Ostertagia ostertagi]